MEGNSSDSVCIVAVQEVLLPLKLCDIPRFEKDSGFGGVKVGEEVFPILVNEAGLEGNSSDGVCIVAVQEALLSLLRGVRRDLEAGSAA